MRMRVCVGSARYGRATAGAVDLLTRPRPEKLEARVGANIVLAGAYVAVPIGAEGGVSAGVRRFRPPLARRSIVEAWRRTER